MRLGRRLLLTSLAPVAATALIAPNAHACMCTDWTQQERIVQSDWIFRGRVISREPLVSGEPTTWQEYVAARYDGQIDVHTFQVLETLKGRLGASIRIYEPAARGLCGSLVRTGQIFLVFAERSRYGRLETGPCGRVIEDADGARTRHIAELMRAGAQRIPKATRSAAISWRVAGTGQSGPDRHIVTIGGVARDLPFRRRVRVGLSHSTSREVRPRPGRLNRRAAHGLTFPHAHSAEPGRAHHRRGV